MGSPTFDYTFLQQLYCLNTVSNVVGLKRGTTESLQTRMQKLLIDALPSLNSDWELVWGPAIYKQYPLNPTTGPINAWFVAKSESAKTYVVSVAGTAAHSPKAWIEDFNIKRIVDFESWTSRWTADSIPKPNPQTWNPLDPNPKIYTAAGTSYSTHNVLSVASPSTARSPNTTLPQFLSRAPLSGYKVVITGHSMGGAVAPTLALGLQRSNLLSSPEEVLVLPSAGATPGNAAFAEAFAAAFPATAEFNTDLFNTLDIVPQAFGTDPSADRKLANILNIYSDAVVKKRGVRMIVKGLYNWVNDDLVKESMPYVPIQGMGFTPSDPIPPIEKRKELLGAMLKEHVEEYFIYWGIQEFHEYLECLGKKYGLHDAEVPSDALAEFEPAGEVSDAGLKGAEVVVEEVAVAVVDV